MEQNFQTSFIPKKPMVKESEVSKRPIGLLTVISVFIFLATILVSGGLYFYQGALTKDITKMESDLNLAKNRFEPTKINQLKVLDRRLLASKAILSNHIAISPIFKALQAITMKTVQYTNFTYSLGADNQDRVKVSLTGLATGYRSVALQSDLFTQNKNLIDPVFSGLALDDKGNVSFSLEFLVDPSFVDYKQMLQTEGSDEPITTPPASTGI